MGKFNLAPKIHKWGRGDLNFCLPCNPHRSSLQVWYRIPKFPSSLPMYEAMRSAILGFADTCCPCIHILRTVHWQVQQERRPQKQGISKHTSWQLGRIAWRHCDLNNSYGSEFSFSTEITFLNIHASVIITSMAHAPLPVMKVDHLINQWIFKPKFQLSNTLFSHFPAGVAFLITVMKQSQVLYHDRCF